MSIMPEHIVRGILGDALIEAMGRVPTVFVGDPLDLPAWALGAGLRVGDTVVFDFTPLPAAGEPRADDLVPAYRITRIEPAEILFVETHRAAPPRRRKAWEAPWPKGSR